MRQPDDDEADFFPFYIGNFEIFLMFERIGDNEMGAGWSFKDLFSWFAKNTKLCVQELRNTPKCVVSKKTQPFHSFYSKITKIKKK